MGFFLDQARRLTHAPGKKTLEIFSSFRSLSIERPKNWGVLLESLTALSLNVLKEVALNPNFFRKKVDFSHEI